MLEFVTIALDTITALLDATNQPTVLNVEKKDIQWPTAQTQTIRNAIGAKAARTQLEPMSVLNNSKKTVH